LNHKESKNDWNVINQGKIHPNPEVKKVANQIWDSRKNST
jgi:hypothetical protein